jgi:hypothetical protein
MAGKAKAKTKTKAKVKSRAADETLKIPGTLEKQLRQYASAHKQSYQAVVLEAVREFLDRKNNHGERSMVLPLSPLPSFLSMGRRRAPSQ